MIRTRVSLPERSVTCCKKQKEKRSSIQRTNKTKIKINSGKSENYFSYDKGIIERGEDVSDTKDMLSLANSRTERDIIFLGLSYLLPPRLPFKSKFSSGYDLKM